MKKSNYADGVFLRTRIVGDKMVTSEVDTYFKVYDTAHNRKKLMALSGTALALLLYAAFKCDRNNNSAALDYDKFSKDHKCHLQTFRRAIKELEHLDIIRLKEGCTYYFDYTILFKGAKQLTGMNKYYPYD